MTRADIDPARIDVPRAGHFDCFDGLRAIAATVVYLNHISITRADSGLELRGFDRVTRAVLEGGDIGVAFFFAISGFLLYRPFVAAHLAGRRSPDLRAFAARRALRIYPAYWVALVAAVVLLRSNVFLAGPSRWFAHLALVHMYIPESRIDGVVPQGLLPSWTLVVEVTFYAFLPAYAYVVRRASTRTRPFVGEILGVAAVFGAGAATLVRAIDGGMPPWVTVLPIQLPLFACGMALAVWSARADSGLPFPRPITAAGRHPAACWAVAAGAYAGVVWLRLADRLPPILGDRWWLVRIALHAISATALLLPAVVGLEDGGRIRSFLRHPVVVFVGTISYGIYLWHTPIMYWIAEHVVGASWNLTLAGIVIGTVALPLTGAIAWASWRFLETPAIRMSRRVGAAPAQT